MELKTILEYKRECKHTKMVHWKKCAECREFLVKKGYEELIKDAYESGLAKAIECLPDRLKEQGSKIEHRRGWNDCIIQSKENIEKEMLKICQITNAQNAKR